jgi:hypothetical protein
MKYCENKQMLNLRTHKMDLSNPQHIPQHIPADNFCLIVSGKSTHTRIKDWTAVIGPNKVPWEGLQFLPCGMYDWRVGGTLPSDIDQNGSKCVRGDSMDMNSVPILRYGGQAAQQLASKIISKYTSTGETFGTVHVRRGS